MFITTEEVSPWAINLQNNHTKSIQLHQSNSLDPFLASGQGHGTRQTGTMHNSSTLKSHHWSLALLYRWRQQWPVQSTETTRSKIYTCVHACTCTVASSPGYSRLFNVHKKSRRVWELKSHDISVHGEQFEEMILNDKTAVSLNHLL